MNSNYTGRFPRFLDSAFGPYERSSNAWIEPMPDEQPMHPADVFVIKWSAICLVALAVIFTFEWIYL